MNKLILLAMITWLLALFQAPLRSQTMVDDRSFTLRPNMWQWQSQGQAAVVWDEKPEHQLSTVTLNTAAGGVSEGKLISQRVLDTDFIAEVTYELINWDNGWDSTVTMGLGVSTPQHVTPQFAQLLRVGREWEGTTDSYQSAWLRQEKWRFKSSVMTVEPKGRLRISRKGAEVRTEYFGDTGWETLQIFDTCPTWKGLNAIPLECSPSYQLFLYVSSQTRDTKYPPRVKVKFSKLRIEVGLPRKGRRPETGGAELPNWTIYANDLNWLRIGPMKEFQEPLKAKDEIEGGTSDAPLNKTLLKEGFESKEEALKYLCERLTKVHVRYEPLATPHETVWAIFRDEPPNPDEKEKEYRLRLDRGNDPEAVFHKGEEYDFAAEKKVLAAHGLTPRVGFRKLWLIHATGHGTVDGPVKDDLWMLFTTAPERDPKNPRQGIFRLPDGWGGTFTYSADHWEGPYRDNFGLARAMKRLGVAEVALYPPGNKYTPKIIAAEVPENPQDYGSEVLGTQSIVDAEELKEWVVYSTADAWLHIGTRKEFDTDVKASETLWAGTGDTVMKRTSVPLGKRFFAYGQALDFLTTKLANVKVGFFPINQPREPLLATVNGRKYMLQLARDPDVAVASYGTYNYSAEMQLLLSRGITPVKTFRKQWLVHVTAYGTMEGDMKTDMWMMVPSEPQNGGVTLSEGDGSTRGYRVDKVEGPFQESASLANALRKHNLKSIGLYAEDRGVSAEEVATVPAQSEEPRIVSTVPDRGEAGQSFYVTIIAKGMKPGYRFRFGPGVLVTNETNLGKNPDGEGERWLATVTVDKDARFEGNR